MWCRFLWHYGFNRRFAGPSPMEMRIWFVFVVSEINCMLALIFRLDSKIVFDFMLSMLSFVSLLLKGWFDSVYAIGEGLYY